MCLHQEESFPKKKRSVALVPGGGPDSYKLNAPVLLPPLPQAAAQGYAHGITLMERSKPTVGNVAIHRPPLRQLLFGIRCPVVRTRIKRRRVYFPKKLQEKFFTQGFKVLINKPSRIKLPLFCRNRIERTHVQMPLTDLLDKYASPLVKYLFNEYNTAYSGKGFKSATFQMS